MSEKTDVLRKASEMLKDRWTVGDWAVYHFPSENEANEFVRLMERNDLNEASIYSPRTTDEDPIWRVVLGGEATYGVAQRHVTNEQPVGLCALGAIEYATGDMGFERHVVDEATDLVSRILVDRYDYDEGAPQHAVYSFNDSMAAEGQMADILLETADHYDGVTP